MNSAIATWLLFRAVKWLTCIFFLGYCLHFMLFPETHLDSFGHLQLRTEALMFGLGNAAVFLAMFELMMRERAGLARPKLGELIPPPARAATSER